MAKDPRRDFLSRQGIKVVRPFFPINAAVGSAMVKTIMAKIKEIGLSHQKYDIINTAIGKYTVP